MKALKTQDAFLQQLGNFYARPHCQPLISRRRYGIYKSNYSFPHPSSRSDAGEFDVGILGGGITGLVSAYWLSKIIPTAKVTLYEASSRLGGWLNTQRVKIADHGEVLFEQGPRSLRPTLPNGALTMLLIEQLGLADQILTTSKDAPAARNRFIYYPDRIVRMPHPSDGVLSIGQSILTEPIFSGIFRAFWNDLGGLERDASLQDESVGDFIARRFHPDLADNIVSAVLHGIYAGDVYSLSAKSLLPSLWDAEMHFESSSTRAGCVGAALLDRRQKGPLVPRADFALMDELRDGLLAQEKLSEAEKKAVDGLKNCSVFTLRGGLGQLSDQIVKHLKATPNTSLHTDSYVQEISLVSNADRPNHKIQIKHKPQTKKPSLQHHTHVLSTIGSSHLPTLTQDRHLAPLSQTPSVTVMVVNLYFRDPAALPIHGFGYLIPRSVPFAQNPERALGVVFDSDATAGQDAAPGTKITVMLGGHWWSGWDAYPSGDEGVAMARAVLRRHLGVDEEPLFARAALQRDCIPQYTVGHEARMVSADAALRDGWGGRLMVAGNSYAGVGVNDCVRAALDVTVGLAGGKWKTGLEMFVDEGVRAKERLEPYGKLRW